MPIWSGFLIAIIVGGALLAGAVWLDARSRRRAEGDSRTAVRGNAEVDALAPAYVTQSEIDALPLPTLPDAPVPTGTGRRFDFGHLSPEFATNRDSAVLKNVRVLMVDGDITATREVLMLLAEASDARPVALLASAFHDDVLDTLRANRRRLGIPVVACTPTNKDLYEVRSLVGGEVLTPADLKAGWVPTEALGHASSWISSMERTRVDPSG